MEAYMLINNPLSVKEAMSKARTYIEAFRYRWQNVLEKKIEFQKTMQSLVKRKEVNSIEKRQYPPHVQRKKREALSPPEEDVRRGKKEKQKALVESTDVTCDATEQQGMGVEGDEEWLKPPEQKKKEAREDKRKEKVKA
ncbi:Protein of unknown function [Gryllus bimaculatus]|nr:Protein of unknown function [Gryllus bimaculatus]